MKKTYTELDVSVVMFENEDIATASALTDLPYDEGNRDNIINFGDIFGGL